MMQKKHSNERVENIFLVPFQLINYVKQLRIYLKEIIRAFLISPVKQDVINLNL